MNRPHCPSCPEEVHGRTGVRGSMGGERVLLGRTIGMVGVQNSCLAPYDRSFPHQGPGHLVSIQQWLAGECPHSRTSLRKEVLDESRFYNSDLGSQPRAGNKIQNYVFDPSLAPPSIPPSLPPSTRQNDSGDYMFFIPSSSSVDCEIDPRAEDPIGEWELEGKRARRAQTEC